MKQLEEIKRELDELDGGSPTGPKQIEKKESDSKKWLLYISTWR